MLFIMASSFELCENDMYVWVDQYPKCLFIIYKLRIGVLECYNNHLGTSLLHPLRGEENNGD